MKKIVVKNIRNSKFIKKLKKHEMITLSKDIREYILDVVSVNGGHLSSNLGICDLTVAMHKVFDFEKDKIIFDVGHQSYPHKILTGRAGKFESLRKLGGISGFQSIDEKDPYEAGHSSTSLSAALGLAIARDYQKEDHNIIAVIGDGSICNGLSYEALCHIGSVDTKLIIILNDNEMSISKNVGAFNNLLDKIRSNNGYKIAKKDTKFVLRRVPFIGKFFIKIIKKIKYLFRNLYNSNGIFFEKLGIKYYGPINGHDFTEMENYLNIAKKSEEPVILHVITKKGYGYKFAEDDEDGVWHGVGPFDKETGEIKSTKNKVIYSSVVSNKVLELSKKNSRIVTITPAMTGGSKLGNIAKELPNQFIDVGIAEEHAVVLANSLALGGRKPFLSIYSSFLQRGYDQLLHDVAKCKSGVVIGVDRCGIIGEDGPSHQGLFDLSFSLPIPNLIITAPKDAKEANSLLELGFSMSVPFMVRYSKNKITDSTETEKIKFATWEVLKNGEDATIITYGDFVTSALKIANSLAKDNINIEVVNARFIKPIDIGMFGRIQNKNKPIFVYEEVYKIGGLGSYLASVNNENVKIFAIDDKFVMQGTRDEVLKKLKLDEKSMVGKIKEYF